MVANCLGEREDEVCRSRKDTYPESKKANGSGMLVCEMFRRSVSRRRSVVWSSDFLVYNDSNLVSICSVGVYAMNRLST